MNIVSDFVRNSRGVTVVEFALISPVMMMMICGTIEIGHLMFARAVLEGAVVEAARAATASMEISEDTRQAVVRDTIVNAMSSFPTAAGKSVKVSTKVYRDFSTTTPENFTDKNANGVYDKGEDFIDRNANGKWDPAIQIPGKLGGPGDVVAYTAEFPKQMLFGSMTASLGISLEIDLVATTVVRNEAVVRKYL